MQMLLNDISHKDQKWIVYIPTLNCAEFAYQWEINWKTKYGW